jgi:hypothetical protein
MQRERDWQDALARDAHLYAIARQECAPLYTPQRIQPPAALLLACAGSRTVLYSQGYRLVLSAVLTGV